MSLCTKRLAVAEVDGKIYTIEDKPHSDTVDTRSLCRHQVRDPAFTRLYGFAFHPNFAENRYCYISYVQRKTPDGSRVSRFKVTDTDPPRIDPEASRSSSPGMAAATTAHLQFGPDGFLYISTGDGGDPFPPDGRDTGQDISDLLKPRSCASTSIIPKPDRPYAIPQTIRSSAARCAAGDLGLRPPQSVEDELRPADRRPVGRRRRLGNVGDDLPRRARRQLRLERRRGAAAACSPNGRPGPTPILPPTVAHSHIEARSITGGYFSRPRLPELAGPTSTATTSPARSGACGTTASKVTWREELVDTPLQMSSFGSIMHGDVLYRRLSTRHDYTASFPIRGARRTPSFPRS